MGIRLLRLLRKLIMIYRLFRHGLIFIQELWEMLKINMEKIVMIFNSILRESLIIELRGYCLTRFHFRDR